MCQKCELNHAKEEILGTVEEVFDDLEDVFEGPASGVQPSKPAPAPRVQGAIRTPGYLHIQYGVEGNYQRGDVAISPQQQKDIFNWGKNYPGELAFSLAGTTRKYLVGSGKADSVNLHFGPVTVKNPFYTVPPSYVW